MSLPLSEVGKRVDDFVFTKAIQLLGGGAEAYLRLAARYESRGWLEEAVATYKKAIGLRPHQAAFRLPLARVLSQLERVPEALKICQESLRLDKTLADAHVLEGTLYLKTG